MGACTWEAGSTDRRADVGWVCCCKLGCRLVRCNLVGQCLELFVVAAPGLLPLVCPPSALVGAIHETGGWGRKGRGEGGKRVERGGQVCMTMTVGWRGEGKGVHPL